MLRTIQHLNYFYIFLAIIWIPLQVAILHVDAAGRILFTLTILVFIVNVIYDKSFKRVVKSKPFIFWLIWVVYSSINLYIKGYHEELPFTFFCVLKLFMPFVVMMICFKEYTGNSRQFLYLLLITFILYGLIDIFLLNDISKIGIDSQDRSWGELRNSGPLNLISLVFISSLFFVQRGIKLYQFLLFIAFAFIVIFIGSTRKALGAAFIILFMTMFSQLKLDPKRIFFLFLFITIFIVGYNYVMNYTTMGQRITETTEQGETTNTTNNKVLNLLGDRAGMYIMGWDTFVKNPITGIGLTKFRSTLKYDYVLHSEYMVQLAEGGLLGTSLYLLFNWGIIASIFKFWKKYPKRRNIIWVLIGGLGAVLFINFTAWTYAFPQYFVVFGLILGQLINMKYENRNTRFRKRIV